MEKPAEEKPATEEKPKAEEKPVAEERKEKEHDVDYGDPEEDAKAKIGGLADVKVTTGTEGELCIYKNRVKLFRFREEQWKERGIGNAKLLRNNDKK